MRIQKGYIAVIIAVILGILLLLVVVGGGAYYLGIQQSKGDVGLRTPMPSIPLSSIPEVNPTLIQKPDVAKYQHPQLHYTLEYPFGWTGGTQEVPEGIKQEFTDFDVLSSDYKVSEGYPVLQSGAEFFIRAAYSNEKSIEVVFTKDLLAQQIAMDKTNIMIDGVQGIQYSFSYEGTLATITMFIKNGIQYSIKYRYVNAAGKQANWNNYVDLLKSFKTAE